MTTTTFVASTDGGTLQVQDFIKQPKLVQSVITSMMKQKFIADGLLRDGGHTPSGAYTFRETQSLYAEGLEVIEEYGEIPVAEATDGLPRAVFTVKGGGALVISQEARDRNDIDVVNRRLRQIKNGMVRFWDERVWTALLDKTPTQAVTLAWTDPTSKIRFDIGKGMETVNNAKTDSGDELGFVPDTLVVHTSRASAWVYNDDIAKVYLSSPLASGNPQYTGDTLRDLMGLRVWVTPHIPADHAYVCERKTNGFIGNEKPLNTTPMYEQRERQAFRSDTTRRSAIGIDAPKAGLFLTGV